MKRAVIAAATLFALSACTGGGETPDADRTTAPSITTSAPEEIDAWKAVEMVAPSLSGATDSERAEFTNTTCVYLRTAEGDTATAVANLEDEYLLTTVRAGALVLYSARWRCPEYLADAAIWAEHIGMIEPR